MAMSASATLNPTSPTGTRFTRRPVSNAPIRRLAAASAAPTRRARPPARASHSPTPRPPASAPPRRGRLPPRSDPRLRRLADFERAADAPQRQMLEFRKHMAVLYQQAPVE